MGYAAPRAQIERMVASTHGRRPLVDDEEYAIRCFEKLQMEFRPKRSGVHHDQVEMRLKVGKQLSDALFGNF